MSDLAQVPPGARRFIVGVLIGGLGVLALHLLDLPSWGSTDLLGFAVLAAGTAVAENFQLELPSGEERLTMSIADALYAAALLLARPSVLVIALAVGVVAGQGVQNCSRRLCLRCRM